MNEKINCIYCKTPFEKKYMTDRIIIKGNGNIQLNLVYLCPHCKTKYMVGPKTYNSIPNIPRTENCTVEKEYS